MARKSIYKMPGHLIRRAHQISCALFSEELKNQDLTSVQFAALVVISDNPDIDATRLSNLIAFDRATLGGVLDRLEAKGLIARSPSSHDRRIKVLIASRGGEQLLGRVQAAVDRVQMRILSPLNLAERKVLLGLLTRLVEFHNEDASPPIAASAPRARQTRSSSDA